MKLKKEFVIHETAEGLLMISVDKKFNGMVRTNGTAASIITLLKEEITFEQIVASMLGKYDVDEQQLRADVEKTLGTLRGIGALDE